MLAFKNNENKANYNNRFLANFKSSNQCQQLSLLKMKSYLIALRELKILVTGINGIVIVVIVVIIISFVVVVISIGYLVLEVDVSLAPVCIVFDTTSLASASVSLPVFTRSLIKLFSLT